MEVDPRIALTPQQVATLETIEKRPDFIRWFGDPGQWNEIPYSAGGEDQIKRKAKYFRFFTNRPTKCEYPEHPDCWLTMVMAKVGLRGKLLDAPKLRLAKPGWKHYVNFAGMLGFDYPLEPTGEPVELCKFCNAPTVHHEPFCGNEICDQCGMEFNGKYCRCERGSTHYGYGRNPKAQL